MRVGSVVSVPGNSRYCTYAVNSGRGDEDCVQYNTCMKETLARDIQKPSLFKKIGQAALIIGGFFIIFYTTYFGTSKWSVTSNLIGIGGTVNAETIGK